MSEVRKHFKVNKSLEEFKGSALMVGCGEAKQHHFHMTAKAISGEILHPSREFYHVSLPADYSYEGKHDLDGDFLDDETVKYLSKKQYSLVCFEAVTEIFSCNKSLVIALENAKKLLSDSGICFIFFGGSSKKSLNLAISRFNYSYSFTYGLNGSWSLIGSDVAFDLLTVLNNNQYLSYMGYHVIKSKFNLNLSYNYFEDGLKKHVKSIDEEDDRIILEINPFVKHSFWGKYKKLNLALQDAENDDIFTEKLSDHIQKKL